MSWRRFCANPESTRRAGEELAALLRAGDVVLLSGQLGAGKTTFVQGVARGLGASDRVTSPTFTIVREHRCVNERGISTLHHADVYRVGSIAEVIDLDLGELLEEGGVAVIEWGEIAAPVFDPEVLSVTFLLADGAEDEGRTLVVDGALARGRAEELGRWAAG